MPIFHLGDQNGNTIKSVQFGDPPDKFPIIGDWDGTRKDKPGVFRAPFFHLGDQDGNTIKTVQFGDATDTFPIIGDWDGTGKDKPGVFRPPFFHLSDEDGNTILEIQFGDPPDTFPIIGDWDGTRKDKPGLARALGAQANPSRTRIEARIASVPDPLAGLPEVRTVISGIHSRIQHREVLKVLKISINALTQDVPKWVQLLACIAGSAALNVFLVQAAFGPVGWATVAAAIVISALVCFVAISTDRFKQADQNEGAEASVVRAHTAWH